MPGSLYDQDFSRWAAENAALLRSGEVAKADLPHIAEELEEMGKSQQRELRSRTRVILMHLLKLEFSRPAGAGPSRSWLSTLRTQRIDLAELLADNPSLDLQVAAAIREVYGEARELAGDETGLSVDAFPAEPPYNADQLKSRDFLPPQRPL